MNPKHSLKLALGVATCVGALAGAPNVEATSVLYHIDLNTASLAGNPNAPFSLDLQLTDGDGINNSSATLSNFSGGGVLGTPLLTGGASGNLASGLVLTDSGFYNDVFQGFTAGGTLSFDLLVSSSATGLTPDGFAIAIANGDGIGFSSFFDVFVQLDLNAGSQNLLLTSPQDGVTASVHVPEIASAATFPVALFTLGLAGLGFRQRKAAVQD